MSVIPSSSRHININIDTFHNSIIKLHYHHHHHGALLSLSSRYKKNNSSFSSSSSFPVTLRNNFTTNDSVRASNSTSDKYPNDKTMQNDSSSSSSNWIDKWKKPRKDQRLKPPREVFNYRKDGGGGRESGLLLQGSSSGGGGGSTMDRIVQRLRKSGYMDENGDDKVDGSVRERERERERERSIEKGSVEDIFYVEEGLLPNTRGGFSRDSPLGEGIGSEGHDDDGDGKEVVFPWEEKEKDENVKEEDNSVKKRSRTYVAEVTLPESELERLKILTLRTKRKLKIGGAGVTQAIVDEIHSRWRFSEIVRIKVEGAAALNMRRVHEILERKTGGLVIWRSGTSVSLYRGLSYEVPPEEVKKWTIIKKKTLNYVPLPPGHSRRDHATLNSLDHLHSPKESLQRAGRQLENPESSEVEYEGEIDKLLSDLGPRYTDWPGEDPIPVDADLLPNVIPGYQPPFRLLPYGVKRSLGSKEATALRNIARTLPPHFALGRSRQLEGLASAMVKLWERSLIAKVALKRGVQLTTSERMAEDLKRLTGGLLLSRNKDFLVFYRGKDFLSAEVTEALLERERLAKSLQDKEEQARKNASLSIASHTDSTTVMLDAETKQTSTAGTLYETLNANAKWGKRLDEQGKEKMRREVEYTRHANLVKKLENKLAYAEWKVRKAERALSKVDVFLQPSDQQADPESITDEERFMFRKLGLRMKAYLLLGRRGVFDGTVENMHLHWKYRELVKIIIKEKDFEEVKNIALSLEAESGGVLVSVDKVSKGYAIVVYRGKDYERPSTMRPKNLLTKRKALARSIELQRREALLKNIAVLQKNVAKLKSEIERMDLVKDQGDSAFYDCLDSAYSSEDEDSEEEDVTSYQETGDEEDWSNFSDRTTDNFENDTEDAEKDNTNANDHDHKQERSDPFNVLHELSGGI